MMRVVIADDQERENLFAEIWADEGPWAEIILDSAQGQFVLTIFPAQNGKDLQFRLDEVEKALAEAREELTNRGYLST